MTDDISMQALTGTIGARSRAAIAAGCDIVLHCNGRLEEMRAVADAVPALAGEADRRTAAALAWCRPGADMDADMDIDARSRFAAMMAGTRRDDLRDDLRTVRS